MPQILHIGKPIVTTTPELCDEILELVDLYVSDPAVELPPSHPDTSDDIEELREYLEERPLGCTTLNVELLATFLTDFESYMRHYMSTRSALWRTLLKLYVDSEAAVPLVKGSRVSEELWFTYKGTPYCVNRPK